jgi:hypothetical protein
VRISHHAASVHVFPQEATPSGPHRPLGRLAFLIPVLEVQSPPRHQRLARNREPGRRARGASGGRDEESGVGEQRRQLLRQDAGHLAEDRFAGARQRGIAELGDDPRAEDQRLDFFPVEHQWR